MTNSSATMKAVFDELYQLHLNSDKESKRVYAEKFNLLTPTQKINYMEYQNNYDIFNRRKTDAEKMEGATKSRRVYDSEKEKLVKKDVSALKFDVKSEFRKFKKQQEPLLNPGDMSREEFDNMLDAAFAEMEAVDLPSQTPGDNFYKPQKFVQGQDLDTAAFNEDIGKPNTEVELRFGMQKTIQGKTFFDSQVSKNSFENLLKFFNPENVLPQKSTVYSKNEGKYKIRIIEDEDSKILQRKSAIRTSNNETFGVRLQTSTEEVLDSANIPKFDLTSQEFTVRQRLRWTFDISGGQKAIFLEITKVIDPRNRKNVRYEVEVEFHKPQNNFDKVVNESVMFLLSKMQDSPKFVTTTQNTNVLMANYNSIFTEYVKGDTQFEFPVDMSMSAYRWGDSDIITEELVQKTVDPYTFVNYENKPSAFEYRNIFSGFEYRVTPKLDGIRTRIFIDINGIFVVDVKTGYVSMIYQGEYKNLAGTVIDCEYYKGEYYPFDVLAYRGVNLISQNFDSRFSTIRKIVDGKIVGESIPGFNYSKPFYGRNNPFDSISECFEWMESNKLEYDGLIFQRNDEPYWKSGYATKSMKWKPLDEITVDLYTRITPEGNIEFYSVDPTIVGGNFSGLKMEYTGKDYSSYEIPPEIAEVGDFIAEYYFVDNDIQLRFKQLRKDKTEPNFHKVVKSNRSTFFYDKVGKNDLLGYTLQPWRKWASQLKRTMVEFLIIPDTRVLDIGVGRGGGALFDLAKKCKQVYGIDPNVENLRELRERLEKFDEDQRSKIVIAKLRGQDTSEIVDLISTKVDVVTMFFSISFFYESEDDFRALIDTIDQTCKKGSRDNKNGSMLIIQMMDGDLIHQLSEGKAMTFGSDPNPEGTKLYKIRTSASNTSREFGTKITISLPSETDTILGSKQVEWIASPETLTEYLAEIGFVKLSDDQMDVNAILPKSNMQFAGLNRSLVYIRGGGVMQKFTKTFNYYNEEEEENFMNPLSIDTMETFTAGGVDVKRVGVVQGPDSFLASVLYGISSKYRDDSSVRSGKIIKIRNNLMTLLDREIFEIMLGGNVAHNIAFDTLYSKNYDTVKDGVQIDIINDIESSKEVAFTKYLEIVKNGYVGYEIADVVGCFWDCRITIYGENGIEIYTANKKGKKRLAVLKIANIGYEPLI